MKKEQKARKKAVKRSAQSGRAKKFASTPAAQKQVTESIVSNVVSIKKETGLLAAEAMENADNAEKEVSNMDSREKETEVSVIETDVTLDETTVEQNASVDEVKAEIPAGTAEIPAGTAEIPAEAETVEAVASTEETLSTETPATATEVDTLKGTKTSNKKVSDSKQTLSEDELYEIEKELNLTENQVSLIRALSFDGERKWYKLSKNVHKAILFTTKARYYSFRADGVNIVGVTVPVTAANVADDLKCTRYITVMFDGVTLKFNSIRFEDNESRIIGEFGEEWVNNNISTFNLADVDQDFVRKVATFTQKQKIHGKDSENSIGGKTRSHIQTMFIGGLVYYSYVYLSYLFYNDTEVKELTSRIAHDMKPKEMVLITSVANTYDDYNTVLQVYNTSVKSAEISKLYAGELESSMLYREVKLTRRISSKITTYRELQMRANDSTEMSYLFKLYKLFVSGCLDSVETIPEYAFALCLTDGKYRELTYKDSEHKYEGVKIASPTELSSFYEKLRALSKFNSKLKAKFKDSDDRDLRPFLKEFLKRDFIKFYSSELYSELIDIEATCDIEDCDIEDLETNDIKIIFNKAEDNLQKRMEEEEDSYKKRIEGKTDIASLLAENAALRAENAALRAGNTNAR